MIYCTIQNLIFQNLLDHKNCLFKLHICSTQQIQEIIRIISFNQFAGHHLLFLLLYHKHNHQKDQRLTMACSKYEYVKQYQQHKTALPQTYMLVRIDGKGFTKFCTAHKFEKPNDLRAIELMNQAAEHVCEKFKDIFIAYGQSDEYSFALSKDSQLFSRRIDKIQTCIVSTFTSAYVFYWPKYFKEMPMIQLPSFDARLVLYPNLEVLKDYFKWRQVDCHINNLYNTAFWCLVKKGMKNTEVQNLLKDTNSGQKNQILFSQFGINYNSIEEVYRRGTIFCYRTVQPVKKTQNSQKFPTKISKQLRVSIRQLKDTCLTTDRILNKLSTSEIQQDKETTKQLEQLRKQLETIKIRYQQIEEKSKGKNNTTKVKEGKIQRVMCYDDLIKDQFWDNLKID